MKIFRRIWPFKGNSKNSTQPIEEKRILFGRSTVIKLIASDIVSRRVIIIVGAQGVGKSALLENLGHVELNIDDSFLVSSLEIDGAVDPATKFMGAVCETVVPKLNGLLANSKRLRAALNENSVKFGSHLATAFLMDSIKAFAPHLEKTGKAAADVLNEVNSAANLKGMAQDLIREGKSSPGEQFKEFIALVAALGVNVLVKIDQFERASDDVVSHVAGIVSQFPANWRLIVTINDEQIPRKMLRGLINQLRFASEKSYRVRKVGPLSITDIEEWALKNGGQALEFSELKKLEEVSHGIPFYIERIIKSDQEKFVDIGMDYKSQIAALKSEKAKHLMHVLVMLPQYGWVPDKFAKLVCDVQTLGELETPLAELEECLFIRRDKKSGIRIYHELIARGILASMGDDLKTEKAKAVQTILQNSLADGLFERAQLNYYEIVLSEWLFNGSKTELSKLLGMAENLVDEGKTEAGLRGLESIEKGIIRSKTQADLRLLKFIQAKALYFRGNFRESIELLNGVDFTNSPKSSSSQLLLIKILIRLARFDEAQSRAQKFLADDSLEPREKLNALRSLNTIARDRGEYAEANNILEKIRNLANSHPTDFSIKDQCDILRTQARTWCFIEQKLDDALEAAQKAVDVAEGNRLLREAGNSHLALGEVLRHSNQNSKAITSYNQAISLARETSDKDSLFWSALGLSDSELRLRNVAAANEVLHEYEWLVQYWDDERPFEKAHFEFSRASVKFLETMTPPSVPEFYSENKINWPSEYVESIIAEPVALPAKRF